MGLSTKFASVREREAAKAPADGSTTSPEAQRNVHGAVLPVGSSASATVSSTTGTPSSSETQMSAGGRARGPHGQHQHQQPEE